MNIDPLILSLLEKPSVSPNDAGCQSLLADALSAIGFTVETLNKGDVSNLWAKKSGLEPTTLLFAGHTDVVPVGDSNDWCSDPFMPTIRGGYLYARGAADMKVALACMVLACRDFLRDYPQHKNSIAFLLTSAEEVTTCDGTKYAIDVIQARQTEQIRWCIVGEPSSGERLGDQIKVGRRGSLSGRLTILGKQGHIAYPHLAVNPIHLGMGALHELANTVWDEGNAYFSPTSLQVSNIHAGVGATNVIPASLQVDFNIRYSTKVTAETLQKGVHAILDAYGFAYELAWSHGGNPFLSLTGALVAAVDHATQLVVGCVPIHSTTGGTSDARFIAPYGIQTVELGFCHTTIHQTNECILVDDIAKLRRIYYHVMRMLLL